MARPYAQTPCTLLPTSSQAFLQIQPVPHDLRAVEAKARQPALEMGCLGQRAVRALHTQPGVQEWLFDRKGKTWRLLGKPRLTCLPSPVHYKVFSIPDFCQLNASSIPSPIYDN